MKPQVLLIEKNISLTSKITFFFEHQYNIDIASTKKAACQKLSSKHSYSCIIIGDSFSIEDIVRACFLMREQNDYTPIITIVDSDQVSDYIKAIRAGADDCVFTSFDCDELFARTNSLIRRQSWNLKRNTTTTFQFGAAYVNFETYEVLFHEKPLRLTTLELKLLRYFIQNRDRVIERKELLSHVWNLHNYPNTRTVDNFVMRLRRLLEPNPQRPKYFLSIRGAGYKFQPQVEELANAS